MMVCKSAKKPKANKIEKSQMQKPDWTHYTKHHIKANQKTMDKEQTPTTKESSIETATS